MLIFEETAKLFYKIFVSFFILIGAVFFKGADDLNSGDMEK